MFRLKRELLFTCVFFVLSIGTSAFCNEMGSIWRDVIKSEFGVDAPANASVIKLMNLHNDLQSIQNNETIKRMDCMFSPNDNSCTKSQFKIKDSFKLSTQTDCDEEPAFPIFPAISSNTEPDEDCHGEYLGKVTTNPYDPDSIKNSYGQYGSPFGNNINNQYSPYGSPYSNKSINNPYATDAPKIYAEDGTYLGKLSSNPYDPESINNPYGKYGNPYGNNLKNPYSQYGNPYSPQSWNNPYTNQAPKIYGSR